MYDNLKQVRLGTEDWKVAFKNKIVPLSSELAYKPTFEIEYYREALLRRFIELVEATCDLYDSSKLIAAISTARTAHETFAVIWYLNIKLKKFIKDKDAEHLTETMNRLMHGWSQDKELPEKINILTILDTVDKNIDGEIRKFYDMLSEFAHPNWSGTLGAYAKPIDSDHSVEFGGYPRLEKNMKHYIESAILASTNLLHNVQSEYADLLNDALSVHTELHDSGKLKEQITIE